MSRQLTPEEEALIPSFVEKYTEKLTVQAPQEKIEKAVTEMWRVMNLAPPQIIICDSPEACKNACPDIDNYSTYWSIWYNSYAAMYDFANHIGEELDKEKLELFLLWCDCCPFILFNETTVYVSRKPVELHFDENDRLHNETGMSCRFSDNYGIWTLNGVDVDEQIVLRPETQTIQQIKEEQNEEVKRLRIERYGWGNYFDGIGAVLVDERRNDIEGTNEYLMEGDNMKALLCICPSTSKEFILEVPPDTKDCRSAQSWLSNGMSERIITAS